MFVCLTKTVHLELTMDLIIKSFLNYLTRYLARWSRCREMYSDNGTNIARNELTESANCSRRTNDLSITTRSRKVLSSNLYHYTFQ